MILFFPLLCAGDFRAIFVTPVRQSGAGICAHFTPVLLFSFPFHPLLNSLKTIHFIVFHHVYFCKRPRIFLKKVRADLKLKPFSGLTEF